jgi:hypothetical protein
VEKCKQGVCGGCGADHCLNFLRIAVPMHCIALTSAVRTGEPGNFDEITVEVATSELNSIINDLIPEFPFLNNISCLSYNCII